MKKIACILWFVFSTQLLSGQDTVEQWINEIVDDMIEMNGLAKYTSQDVPQEVIENFMFVNAVKDITIEENTFSFLIQHYNGQYCTKMTFAYKQVENVFELVFSDIYDSKVLNMTKQFINPWKEKINICK